MTNVKRYDINYAKVVTERLPEPIRSAEVIPWISRLCDPLVFIYNLVIAFRQAKLYELSITPQVCFLEKMLNDRYDHVNRRIYILDGQTFDPAYDYLKAELKPSYLYTKAEGHTPIEYDFLKGELGALSFDFVVFVPSALTFDLNEMTGLINNYKLASKFFTIQTTVPEYLLAPSLWTPVAGSFTSTTSTSFVDFHNNTQKIYKIPCDINAGRAVQLDWTVQVNNAGLGPQFYLVDSDLNYSSNIAQHGIFASPGTHNFNDTLIATKKTKWLIIDVTSNISSDYSITLNNIGQQIN